MTGLIIDVKYWEKLKHAVWMCGFNRGGYNIKVVVKWGSAVLGTLTVKGGLGY